MWFVYILECSDGSYYTGITNDLEYRIKQHNAGKGSKYVCSRSPARLIASIRATDRSSALKIEAYVKKQRKEKKISALYSSAHSTQNK